MRARSPRAAVAIGVAAVLAAACAREPEHGTRGDERILVAVSVPPLADLVAAVGGERVRTVVAMPPGADPHAFEPAPSRMASLERADLAVGVGTAGLPWERTLLDRPERPLLTLATSPSPDRDPHAWLDSAAVAELLPRLVEALAAADPEGAEGYRERGAVVAADVEGLRAAVRERLEPLAGHAYFVDHPAWSRLTAPHGVAERALEAGHREPTPAALAARIDEAREARIATLFVRPGPLTPAARTFLEATGARAVVLDPLAVPWRDNLLAAARAIAESLDAG